MLSVFPLGKGQPLLRPWPGPEGEKCEAIRQGQGMELPNRQEVGSSQRTVNQPWRVLNAWGSFALPSRPAGLLLLTALLLQIQLARMSPTGLICDRRLIQKHIIGAVGMEETVVREVLLSREGPADPAGRVDWGLGLDSLQPTLKGARSEAL